MKAQNRPVFSFPMDKYYDYDNFTIYRGGSTYVDIKSPLKKIPILMSGGHIFVCRPPTPFIRPYEVRFINNYSFNWRGRS
ncbi:hypothetical protein BDZ91DRAFT_738817, partial [Kalaharituber pfeilii]